jgi:ribonuclease HII
MVPTRDLMVMEREALARGEIVVGLDEVGRGALAGPLAVGAVVVTSPADPPLTLTDSKALTPAAREALVDPLKTWVADWAIGWSTNHEIDAWGLRTALAVAATRAVAQLHLTPTFVLADGSFNLLDAPDHLALTDNPPPPLSFAGLAHRCVIKGDATCASIAAASVLAKVARDALMVELDAACPGYGFRDHKGYGAPTHLAALRERGPSEHHRVSWRLPVTG